MSRYLTPEIQGLIEDGKLPLEIAKKILNTNDDNLLQPGDKQEMVPERFPDEIVTISQALAYRRATLDDVTSIFEILNTSYAAETVGCESFRMDEPAIPSEDIALSISEESLSWLIVEVPEGRGTSADGSIIAMCAFTTDGMSRRNGEIEGNLGSIRFFSVIPQYQGLHIGVRLLDKLEMEMRKSNPRCIRMMFSIPSTRKSMLKWIERQRFIFAGVIPYPSGLEHTLKATDVKLHVYLRAIEYSSEETSIMDADSKNPNEIETVLKLNAQLDLSNMHRTGENAPLQEYKPNAQIEFTDRRALNLPPQWRPEMYKSDEFCTNDAIDDVKAPMMD